MKQYLSANSGSFIFLILFLLNISSFGSDTSTKSEYSGFPDATSVTLTCQVTLSSGESPEGTLLTLTGVNNPALFHQQYAPESGLVVFEGVIEANYRLNAVLQGYYEFDTLITILDNRQIPVFLQEIMNEPRNLSVDSLSLRATWQAPVPVYAGFNHRQPEMMKTGKKTPVLHSIKSGLVSGHRSFTGYGVFLDGELVGNTPDTSFVFEPLVYGQSYLAGVVAIYFSGYSEHDTCRFTSRFLYPPRNASGEVPIMTDYCHIIWEAPEDPQNPGQPVPGITGYRIYRNQVFLADVPYDTTEYFDLGLVPVSYSYHITAVYDLTPYGFDGQTGESMTTDRLDVSVIYGYELPFVENFNTGLFETNQWTVEGSNNWRISGQVGNIAPSAEFYFSPVIADYSLSLTSFYLIGAGYIDGSIMLDFDLKHTLVNSTGDEKLKVEVFNGSEWIEVAEFVNNESLDWEPRSIDITEPAKGNIFRVRFTAHGIATADIFNWMIDNIHVYRSCAPPTDLEASIYLPYIYRVFLNWIPPGGNIINHWIGWDYGGNDNAIGLEGGGTFHAAIRFTPTQLSQYTDASLTKIRVFPFGPDGSIVLKVWKGVNAGILLHSQPINSYIPGQWNEFILTNSILIDLTSELWIGYEVTHTATIDVAGCDAGPAIVGFGDMISFNGTIWESMATAYDLNFNWNLQGYVEGYGNAGSGKYLGAEIKKDSLQSHKTINKVENEEIINLSNGHSNREIQGYLIYRDDEIIATTDTTFYIDDLISIGSGYYCYKVSTVYMDCESESTYEICLPVGIGSISYKNMHELVIYPNPSTGLFYIDTEGLEGKLSVYSFSGKRLLETPVSKNEKPVLSLEKYPEGAYLLKIVTDSGETFTGKVVVAR